MNAFAKVDVETFLKFAAEHSEQRYELEKGVIVQQMTGGTKRHGMVARQLCRLFEDQLDAAFFSVVPERGVKIGTSARYPDIVVEPSNEPGESLITSQPILIVEVLSPSTTATDLNTKPSEYLTIPTLLAYVVASQHEPAMLTWLRGADGKFPAEPVEIEGIGQALDINCRGIAVNIPFADVYRVLS